MIFFHLALLGAFVIFTIAGKEENTTLLLVQTLFRHGDRAPIHLYPNDPNSEDAWTNGMGRLTQLGKKQHYEVGKFLRSFYQDFVTSDPKEVYVNSSSEERCLNSAAANLASFYAPEERWKLEEDFEWQPIPVHYLPTEEDIYLNYQTPCPRGDVEVVRQHNSKHVQDLYLKYETMVEDVSNYSGLDYSIGMNSFNLFDILETEKRHHLIVPEWAAYFWDEMSEIAYAAFQTFYSSPVQLRLRTGPFLGVLNENLKSKISGNAPDLKVIMNSAHDVNLAGVLRAFNFTDMPRPPFCATLLFELHEMADASMAVRMLYLNSTQPLLEGEEPRVLVLENCSEYCPLKNFTASYEWLIPAGMPDQWEEECQLNESDENNSYY